MVPECRVLTPSYWEDGRFVRVSLWNWSPVPSHFISLAAKSRIVEKTEPSIHYVLPLSQLQTTQPERFASTESSLHSHNTLYPTMSSSQRALSLYGSLRPFQVIPVDLFPTYTKNAMTSGLDAEVFLDTIPEGKKAIGTHSGVFHSDEALSVSLLRILPEFRNHGRHSIRPFSFAVTVRTRNQELLKECDIVVDVGGLYDVDQSICMETVIVRKRFDHHQKEFKDTFDADHHTKLSSAGLV